MNHPTLSDRQFNSISNLAYEKTGILFDYTRLEQLSNRLRRRLAALDMPNFEAYERYVRSEVGIGREEPHFLNAVTTNETYFFRTERLWQTFDRIVGEMIEQRRQRSNKTLRVWSAACSSGEEPYTCAILLSERLADIDSWNIEIVGSDISPRALDKATNAAYDRTAVSRMNPERIHRWFEQQNGAFRLKDEIRNMVEFTFHNLRDAFPRGPFDIILLRNVLMYFDVPMKKRAIDAVTDALAPGGRLIVGDVDSILACPELARHSTLDYVGSCEYAKPQTASFESVEKTTDSFSVQIRKSNQAAC